jgi:hypothetical protein
MSVIFVSHRIMVYPIMVYPAIIAVDLHDRLKISGEVHLLVHYKASVT